MAVENFTKLKKQEHFQGKNEVDEEFDTFMKGCLLQAKLCTKITHIPVSDSGYSIGMEYIDNEVCSEGKPVNGFEYNDEKQALSFVILSMSYTVC